MAAGFSRRVIARTVASKLLVEPERRTQWIRALAGYLTEHNRTGEADLIANDIARELFAQGGELLVHVTTSRALTDQVRSTLTQTIAADTGAKNIALTEHIDSNLVGGLVAQTPDAILDASVRTQLQQLAAIK